MPDTRAAILHVDLDAFYASVEQRAEPSRRGRPVIVGGLGPRGVVAAASYEARRFGVHSATPMARARRACPAGVFLAPRFDAYREASAQVMAILREVTPLVEAISLDEVVLDTRGAARRLGTGPEIAAALRTQIRAETDLTASVGVGTTKLIAKLASDLAKPDGMLVVEPGTETAFLEPLEVTRLWGVGPATRRRLERLGVRTVGDLATIPCDALERALGRASGTQLYALARNQDDRPVVASRAAKSIGHEETFATDVADRARLDAHVDQFAARVATRLREVGVVARTVVLKVRYGDFRTITRSRTVPEPTDLAEELASVGRELLRGVDLRAGVRLLGLSVQQLVASADTQPQLPLDAPPGPDREARGDLERAVDDVRRRFGDDAVRRAPVARP
ncbi:MAG TPA: DNA polymerase IV [Acidimicrobiia bacterium]